MPCHHHDNNESHLHDNVETSLTSARKPFQRSSFFVCLSISFFSYFHPSYFAFAPSCVRACVHLCVSVCVLFFHGARPGADDLRKVASINLSAFSRHTCIFLNPHSFPRYFLLPFTSCKELPPNFMQYVFNTMIIL